MRIFRASELREQQWILVALHKNTFQNSAQLEPQPSRLPRASANQQVTPKPKARMKNVTLIIFALTTAMCRADLFDNEAQLALRYGRPVQMAGDSRFYRWGGIYVAVQLKDIGQGYKVSVSEAYKREDAGRLTPSDIAKCLPSPTMGGKWIQRSDT